MDENLSIDSVTSCGSPVSLASVRVRKANDTSSTVIHKAKDLSPDQRLAIEGLLGRSIGENEEIIIRAADRPAPPEWLKRSWEGAHEQGLDQLSAEEIDAEIAAVRQARRERPICSDDTGRHDTNVFVSALLQPQGLPQNYA